MADPTTVAPPPQEKLSPAKTILGAQSAIQDIAGRETAMAENLQTEDRAAEKQENEAISALEKERQGLHPPELEQMPKFTPPQQTDPVKQWSSAAMIFAAIGSLFTRRPLTTAINAASATLDAYRKNDIENASAAYKQWQDSFNNWMKVQTFELDEYKSALGDIRDREKMVMDIGKQESTERIAEVNALGHAFGSQLMAEARTEEDAWRAIDEMERVKFMMAEQGPRLAILQAQAAALAKVQQDPQYIKAGQNKDYQTQYRMLRGAGFELSPEQEIQYVKGVETTLTRQQTPGGDYIAAQRNLEAVERASAKGAAGGVVYQAELQDAFTQIINGGRAIRGFQAKMNTEHAGLFDRAQAEVNQWIGKGGNLSQRMIEDMKILSEEVAQDRQAVYAVTLLNAQDEAKERGISDQYAKSIHPYFPDEGYLDKMRQSIGLLRQHPSDPAYIDAFERRFGVDARFAVLAGVPVDDTGAATSAAPAP